VELGKTEMQWVASTFADFNPLDWWIAAFIVTGLVVGVLAGYFKARKIQPKGFKCPSSATN
jgi:hypothetical protein